MIATNITSFRKNVFSLLEQTIKYNEPLSINTKAGNAIVLSEEDYNGMIETIYLMSVPTMKEKLLEGKNTSLSECIPENEVEW
jgi:Phd_YefM.